MKSILLAAVALLAAGTNVAAFCGDWDQQTEGSYTVSNNLWGSAAPASGTQCTEVDSYKNSVIAWETTWTWSVAPQYSVKSYANVGFNYTPRKLSSIKKIPVVWDWTATDHASSVYDVSFDTFLAATPTGAHTYEIMVWVDSVGGAGPIGGSIGTYTVNGIKWNLHKGPNGDTTVYSFVAPSAVKKVSFDLLAFFTFLEGKKWIPKSQYLTVIQAGTEPFHGSSTLKTTAFKVSIQ